LWIARVTKDSAGTWSVVSELIGGLKDQFCVNFGEGKGDRSPVLHGWCELGIDRSGFAALFRSGLTSKNLHASSMTSILRSRAKNLMVRLPGLDAFLSVSTAEIILITNQITSPHTDL
jgi:hypothetical protein